MATSNLDRLFQKQVNVYRLQELSDSIATGACNAGSRFVLTETTIRRLHSVAMHKLLDSPGEYRQGPVHLTNCPHVPPPWVEVKLHMEGLCDYVNKHWDDADLVHLCAFVMWRLNWIHPFANGNGRVSRAVSYMVLNIKYGQILPSKYSIIQQIVEDRQPYYAALRMADESIKIDSSFINALQPLEALISEMLKKQIVANL